MWLCVCMCVVRVGGRRYTNKGTQNQGKSNVGYGTLAEDAIYWGCGLEDLHEAGDILLLSYCLTQSLRSLYFTWYKSKGDHHLGQILFSKSFTV